MRSDEQTDAEVRPGQLGSSHPPATGSTILEKERALPTAGYGIIANWEQEIKPAG